MVRTNTDDDNGFRSPTVDYTDDVERGDEVEYRYRNDDGDTVTGRGVVCKAPNGKVVVLLPDVPDRRALRVFKTDYFGTNPGQVHTNNREGNGRTKRVGSDAKLRRTGVRVSVSYKQHDGYRVVDDDA